MFYSGVAKNVILFLGDGMSIPTLAATRVYYGGEEMELSFERLPHTALSKVKRPPSNISFNDYLGLTLTESRSLSFTLVLILLFTKSTLQR